MSKWEAINNIGGIAIICATILIYLRIKYGRHDR